MANDRLDEVEKAVKHHPDPVVSASDVVEALEIDVTRRTVLDDLRLLERAEAVESKEIGARAVAWWHVDRVNPAPPRDPADHPHQRALEETTEPVGEIAGDADRESVDGLEFLADEIDGLRDDLSGDEFEAVADLLESSAEDVDGSIRFRDRQGNLTGDLEADDVAIGASRFDGELVVDATVGAPVYSLGSVESSADAVTSADEIIDELDLPGSGATLEARRDAVRACYEFVRENGSATKSEFVDALYSEHSARYGSSGGWWNAVGKQGLREVAESVDALEAPGEGEHVWEWTGSEGDT